MENKRKHKKKVTIIDEKSSPLSRASRLRMLRNLANLTRTQLSETVKTNVNTLKNWELGKYGGLPIDGAEKILFHIKTRGVDCTLDWLLHEIGVGPVAVTDIIKAQEDKPKINSIISNQNEEELIVNELLLFRKQFQNTIDFKIEDDGMEPIYKQTDYVAGIKHYQNEIFPLIGRICIIQTIHGKTLLRRLKVGSKNGFYTLLSDNLQSNLIEPVLYDVEISSAAPVIRHYRTSTAK